MTYFNYEPYLKKFNDFLTLRDLAANTIKNYNSFLRRYFNWLDGNLCKKPEDISYEELRSYIFYLKDVEKLSNRSINAHISQLRFLTLYVLNKPWDSYQIPRMKFNTTLPDILSKDEVFAIIDAATNLKHKAVIALLYSAGLRKSEVLHLKYKDISRKNMRIYVSPSKSRRDRYALLSHKTLDILTEYWFKHGKPYNWLFPGTKQGKPISTSTIDRFVKNAAVNAGIDKNINPHIFRHTFGTHLYEQGTDLLTIQKLLGHKSINSTTIYVHLASTIYKDTINPFDYEDQSYELSH